MFVTLRNGEDILIESTRHKIKVITDYRGDIQYTTADKTTIKVTDLEFDKQIKELGEKFFKVEQERGWNKDKKDKCWEEVNKTLDLIKDYVNKCHEHLKLEKGIILNALESNRTYSYNNYYQPSCLPNIRKIEVVEEQLSKAHQEAWDKKKAHDKEIIEWQTKVSDAKKLYAKSTKIKAEAEADWDIHVNCPYCDDYQQIKEFEDAEGGSINHECEKCGEVFTVEWEGFV